MWRAESLLMKIYRGDTLPEFHGDDIKMLMQEKDDVIRAEVVSLKEITKGREQSKLYEGEAHAQASNIDEADDIEDEDMEEDTEYRPLRLCHVQIVILTKEDLHEFLKGYCVESCKNLIESNYDKYVKLDLFYCKGRSLSKHNLQLKGLGAKLLKYVFNEYRRVHQDDLQVSDLEKFPIVLEADTMSQEATRDHPLFKYYALLGFNYGPFPYYRKKEDRTTETFKTAIMYKLP